MVWSTNPAFVLLQHFCQGILLFGRSIGGVVALRLGALLLQVRLSAASQASVADGLLPTSAQAYKMLRNEHHTLSCADTL